MPERFKVVCTMQGAIQVLSFTFTFTFMSCLLTRRYDFRKQPPQECDYLICVDRRMMETAPTSCTCPVRSRTFTTSGVPLANHHLTGKNRSIYMRIVTDRRRSSTLFSTGPFRRLRALSGLGLTVSNVRKLIAGDALSHARSS